MADTKMILEQAYSAFHKRDIDGALALMTEDVKWPKASEGDKVLGKEEFQHRELYQRAADHIFTASGSLTNTLQDCDES